MRNMVDFHYICVDICKNLPKSLTIKKINHHLFFIIFEDDFYIFKRFWLINTLLTQMLQSTNTITHNNQLVRTKKMKNNRKQQNINNIFVKRKEFSQNFHEKCDDCNFATNVDFGRF